MAVKQTPQSIGLFHEKIVPFAEFSKMFARERYGLCAGKAAGFLFEEVCDRVAEEVGFVVGEEAREIGEVNGCTHCGFRCEGEVEGVEQSN